MSVERDGDIAKFCCFYIRERILPVIGVREDFIKNTALCLVVENLKNLT